VPNEGVEVNITLNDLDELESCKGWKVFMAYLQRCQGSDAIAALAAESWDEVQQHRGSFSTLTDMLNWAKMERDELERREALGDAAGEMDQMLEAGRAARPGQA
jgi:hypothetical protein